MNKIKLILAALLLAVSTQASAWWGNDYYNDWPVWTPMYWMEEMENEWDDDYYGPYGYGPYGYPGYGYGYPGYGYGYPGYGYGAPGYGPGYYGGYAPYYPRW